MSKVEKLEDLVMWQKAIELATEIYKLNNPALTKDFALIDQLRRSAISVSSNIAEGYGRGGNKEFKQFLSIAKGSLYELKTQLIIANRITLITEAELDKLTFNIDEIAKMISGMMNYLKSSKVTGYKHKIE
jgi:four helix bundle protein